MKILFVNPPSTTCIQATKPGNYIEENIGNEFVPLSKIPFEVMAKLEGLKNIEKEIILLDFEWYKNPNLSKEDLVKIVIDKKPDIILTESGAQASIDTLDWLTSKFKEKLPNTIVIVGGQAITHLQEKVFKFCPNIDFALLGNADKSLPKLIDHIQNNNSKEFLRQIEGLIYRDKDIGLVNCMTYDELKTFSKEIYEPFREYIVDLVSVVGNRGTYILGSEEFSKGCPFMCQFCAAKRKYQEKNLGKVMEVIKYLYSLGIYRFYIEDLTFGVNRKHRERVLDTLKKFKQENSKFGFRCITRVDLIDDDFVKKLLEAGCYEIGVGVECNEGTVLELMNKKTCPDKNIKALKILGDSGISIRLYLIEGFPCSNTKSSKSMFELLNYLEDKKYNYFVQPALNRDIIPFLPRFKEKEQKGILRRGNLNQLDFRHDGRKYDWDTDRSIRSICYLMLAYPSTELGRENKDEELQKRILLDLPFLKDSVKFEEIIGFVNELPVDSTDKDLVLSLRNDFVHYLDGILTIKEIIERLNRLYSDGYLVNNEVDLCYKKLRKAGLVDSFGNPNDKEFVNVKKFELVQPKRKENILMLFNGKNKRYLYAPRNKEVIKIKTCFYQNIPKEVYEFLVFLKGKYTISEIAERLFKLFGDNKDFETLETARKTTKDIYQSCKKYELCD